MKCTCGYEGAYYRLTGSLYTATKPAVKMWRKENNKPLTWPDAISLIKWLTKKAKEKRK